jgi:hypothetical protein
MGEKASLQVLLIKLQLYTMQHYFLLLHCPPPEIQQDKIDSNILSLSGPSQFQNC